MCVLGCSDSRVPVEIVFDQGLGDMFVIRCAGNVADTVNTASIEYAVQHLMVKVLVRLMTVEFVYLIKCHAACS